MFLHLIRGARTPRWKAATARRGAGGASMADTGEVQPPTRTKRSVRHDWGWFLPGMALASTWLSIRAAVCGRRMHLVEVCSPCVRWGCVCVANALHPPGGRPLHSRGFYRVGGRCASAKVNCYVRRGCYACRRLQTQRSNAPKGRRTSILTTLSCNYEYALTWYWLMSYSSKMVVVAINWP